MIYISMILEFFSALFALNALSMCHIVQFNLKFHALGFWVQATETFLNRSCENNLVKRLVAGDLQETRNVIKALSLAYFIHIYPFSM